MKISMKKLSPLLLCSLAILSGCSHKKTHRDNKNKVISSSQDQYESAKELNTLVEPVDTFVFEEEENPFTTTVPRNHIKTQKSVEDEGWQEFYTEQKKHGFKRIFFAFDSYDIQPDQKAAINHDLDIIKKAIHSGKAIVVEGHACDSAGSAKYNMMLSEKRAQTVSAFLQEHAIPATKIRTVGRGSEMRIVPCGDRAQQAPNRRVDFYIVK